MPVRSMIHLSLVATNFSRSAFVSNRGGTYVPTELIFGFCLWLTLTIAWAAKAGPAGTEAAYWWLAGLGFLVVLTTVTTPREVGGVALAFVIGSVISVIIGVGTGSLNASVDAISQTAIQGRFTGGGGDPNEQAAAFVAAMFLIVG